MSPVVKEFTAEAEGSSEKAALLLNGRETAGKHSAGRRKEEHTSGKLSAEMAG